VKWPLVDALLLLEDTRERGTTLKGGGEGGGSMDELEDECSGGSTFETGCTDQRIELRLSKKQSLFGIVHRLSSHMSLSVTIG